MRVSLLATAATVTLAASAVQAQTAAEPAADPVSQTTQLDEIVVTANKRAENIQSVASSVTAISAQLIDRLQADNLSDLGAYIPGLNVQSSGIDANRLVVRGLSTGPNDLSPSVGVYLDDAPFGATSGYALGALFSPDVDPFDLERVEVLRGPQGTLYGASTLGGLVKYVTRDPSLTTFGVNARTDYTYNDDSGTEGYALRAGVSIPIVTDVAALRISGFYTHSDGDTTDVRTGETGLNAATRKGGRADLLIEPTDDLTVKLSALFAQNDVPRTGQVTGNAVTLQPTYDEYSGYNYVIGYANSEYAVYQANIQYRLPNDLSLTSTSSYSEFEVNQVSDLTATFQPALGALGPLLQFYGPVNPVTEKFTQEFRLTSPENERFEWLGGLFYNEEESNYHAGINSTYMFGATPPPVLAPTVALLANYQTADVATRYTEYAAFANGTYYLTPAFDVSAGVRYSRNDQELVRNVSGYIVLLGATPAYGEAESSDSVWTQSFDARWRFREGSMVYARAARGYRPGGPNAVGGSFEPDTTWNYELGLKGSALDGVLQGNLAAFYIDWTNVQLNFFNGTNTIIGNAGDARSQGFEGEVSWLPFAGFSVNANLAYTDAEITDLLPGATGGAQVGDALPFNSKWAGAVRADYYFALTEGVDANIGAGLRYKDAFTTTFPGDTGTRFYELPSTTFVDLRGGLNFDRFALNLQILNLMNERKLSQAAQFLAVPRATADALGQPVTLGYTPGRSISLSLTARF